MAVTAELIYSAGTLNLLDRTNYLLQDEGWAPAITYLSDNDFGGVCDYVDVDETMTVLVNGATHAVRYQNLRKLQQALDEATRWVRGESLSAVRLRFQPEGGSAILENVVRGRPVGGENPFGLSTAYGGAANAIGDNVIRFQRRGLWLSGSETSAASSATTSNKVMTCAFSAHPIPSPVRLALSNVANTVTENAHLLVASGASTLQSLSFTSASSGSSSPLAATGAHTGGNVIRFTPTGVVFSDSYFFDSSDLSANTRGATIIHPYITCQTNDDYLITAVAMLLDETEVAGPTISVPNSFGATQVIPLGALPIAGKMQSLRIIVSTRPSGGTASFDTLAIIGQRDSFVRDITINVPFIDNGTANVGTLTIDHQLLSKPEAIITHGPNTMPTSHQGDPAILLSGASLSAIWLATWGGTSWANSSASGGGNHTLTAYRRNAYYLPE